MRKITVLLAVLVAAGAVFLYLQATPRVCIGLSCVPVELAATPAELEQGLMYRESLDGGMLFLFPQEGRPGFWMMNMRFPIDIIWISGEKKVVDISRSVPPCAAPCPLYYPSAPVRYVLEVPANYSLQKNIRVGDPLVFIGINKEGFIY